MIKRIISTLIIFFCISNMFFTKIIFANEADNQKTIYLTFDDGISKEITPKILDILDSENVKATFFLIGKTLDDNKDILKAMAEKGHSLGLHSFTHERANVYCSKAGFLKEMKQTQDKIFELTGIKSNVLRFPFGTRNLSFRINKDWEKTIHENNLKIYDWNVDSTDGSSPHNSPALIAKNSKSTENTIILLMHCADINKNSALALKDIIKYYKANGYDFKIITEETEEMYRFKTDQRP